MSNESDRWIKRSEEEPDSRKWEYILVLGSVCQRPHVAYHKYDEWTHTECCYKNGGHFEGEQIEFEKWMPIEWLSQLN